MKIYNLIKENGFEKAIESISPIRFYTDHEKRDRRLNSWMYAFFRTFGIYVYLLFKLRILKTPPKTNLDVLFYVPNEKYSRFLSALVDSQNYSFRIIAERKYEDEIINLNTFEGYRGFLSVHLIFAELLKIFSYAIRKNELQKFKLYYWDLMTLIRREVFVYYTLKFNCFSKFFSFHPGGDLHQIIQLFYSNRFKKNYAIRPTTTSNSKEHQFILTDNLFYKNPLEYEIFQKLIAHKTNLLKAGIIIKGQNITDEFKKTKVLYLDTCNNLEAAKANKIKAITDFLAVSEEINTQVLFKFHPATHAKDKNDLLQLLNTYNCKVVDHISWGDIKLCIGHNTTLFYDAIVNDTLVCNLSGHYDMFPHMKSEFRGDNIVQIQKKEDFLQVLKNDTTSEAMRNLMNKQSHWFKEYYNYPEGMQYINRLLTE